MRTAPARGGDLRLTGRRGRRRRERDRVGRVSRAGERRERESEGECDAEREAEGDAEREREGEGEGEADAVGERLRVIFALSTGELLNELLGETELFIGEGEAFIDSFREGEWREGMRFRSGLRERDPSEDELSEDDDELLSLLRQRFFITTFVLTAGLSACRPVFAGASIFGSQRCGPRPFIRYSPDSLSSELLSSSSLTSKAFARRSSSKAAAN